MAVEIRGKVDQDLDACVALVHSAQESDGWPPLFPHDVAQFISPPHERAGWVAVDDDGGVVGHVALHDVRPGAVETAATQVTGRAAEQLVVLARLVTDHTARGTGLGRRLLDHATEAAHAEGRRPVLDVAHVNRSAIAFYEHVEGWGRARTMTLTVSGGRTIQSWLYLGPEPPPA